MHTTLLKQLKKELLKNGFRFTPNNEHFLLINIDVLEKADRKIRDMADDFLKVRMFKTLNADFKSPLAKRFKRLHNTIIENLETALPKEGKEILDILDNAFLVGGCVRDIIVDIEPKDFDIVTDNVMDFKDEFIKKGFSVKEVGEHFGVLMVEKNGQRFEIATFRKDLDHNGVGATNVEIGTFEDDWQRRDFTINAIYVNLKNKKVLDPAGGVLDAENKVLRFIGNPKDRIEEDAIRLVRMLKFVKKGFKPTQKTLKAFRSNFHLLCKAHPERIREHLELLVDLQRIL